MSDQAPTRIRPPFVGPLRPGQEAQEVKLVQGRLGLEQTGVYDQALGTAVAAFKQLQGLPDGPEIDKITWSLLWP